MFSQQVTPLHLARINDDAATSIDVSAVRNDVYLGPGYHVVVPEKAANEYCTIIFGSGADMFCVR
jgi:hypothetical protein